MTCSISEPKDFTSPLWKNIQEKAVKTPKFQPKNKPKLNKSRAREARRLLKRYRRREQGLELIVCVVTDGPKTVNLNRMNHLRKPGSALEKSQSHG